MKCRFMSKKVERIFLTEFIVLFYYLNIRIMALKMKTKEKSAGLWRLENMKKRVWYLAVIVMILICQVTTYAKTYEYDDLNRVVKVVYDDGSYVTYEYDRNGNIIKINVYDKDGSKVEEETTSKKQGEETTKKQEQTTSKKQEETTSKKQEQTTSKKQEEATTKKQEQTTSKKQEEATTKKQGEATSKQQETTAKKQEEMTTKKYEQAIIGEQNTASDNNTQMNIQNIIVNPFESIIKYISQNNNNKQNSDSKNNEIYIKNENSTGNKTGINNKGTSSAGGGKINNDEDILRFELKVESFMKRLMRKVCDWIILQLRARSMGR